MRTNTRKRNQRVAQERSTMKEVELKNRTNKRSRVMRKKS